MDYNMSVKLSIREANLIIEAVQAYRRVQHITAGVAFSDEEKLSASQKVLLCEQILRGLGAEFEDLSKIKATRTEVALAQNLVGEPDRSVDAEAWEDKNDA